MTTRLAATHEIVDERNEEQMNHAEEGPGVPSVMDQIAAAEKARKDRIAQLLGERDAKTSVHELALKTINDELKALGHKRPRKSPMRTPKNATAGGAK